MQVSRSKANSTFSRLFPIRPLLTGRACLLLARHPLGSLSPAFGATIGGACLAPRHRWSGVPGHRLRSLLPSQPPHGSQPFEAKDSVSSSFVLPASTLSSREEISKYLVKKKRGRKLGQKGGRKDVRGDVGQGKKQKTTDSDPANTHVTAGPGHGTGRAWLTMGRQLGSTPRRPHDPDAPRPYPKLLRSGGKRPLSPTRDFPNVSTAFATSHLLHFGFKI